MMTEFRSEHHFDYRQEFTMTTFLVLTATELLDYFLDDIELVFDL
jgi:hypothetical protein